MYQNVQVLSKTVLALICILSTGIAQSQASDVSTLKPISIARVTDGDTVVSSEGDRIRLWGIDAPEANQPYGKEATIELSELIKGKKLFIEIVDTDRYGRGVGRIYTAEGIYINHTLICSGAAWWYERYAPKALDFRNCELEARRTKTGLWGLSEVINPSDWRLGRRSESDPEERSASFICGKKGFCHEMTSCEEAKYHLSACGLQRLDGDKDGIPCESICR